VPCTVLDPFAGTFTTGEVAVRLGRRAVGIELSKEYCDDHIIPRLEKPLQMEMAL
jgi:DNA modification methylase